MPRSTLTAFQTHTPPAPLFPTDFFHCNGDTLVLPSSPPNPSPCRNSPFDPCPCLCSCCCPTFPFSPCPTSPPCSCPCECRCPWLSPAHWPSGLVGQLSEFERWRCGGTCAGEGQGLGLSPYAALRCPQSEPMLGPSPCVELRGSQPEPVLGLSLEAECRGTGLESVQVLLPASFAIGSGGKGARGEPSRGLDRGCGAVGAPDLLPFLEEGGLMSPRPSSRGYSMRADDVAWLALNGRGLTLAGANGGVPRAGGRGRMAAEEVEKGGGFGCKTRTQETQEEGKWA